MKLLSKFNLSVGITLVIVLGTSVCTGGSPGNAQQSVSGKRDLVATYSPWQPKQGFDETDILDESEPAITTAQTVNTTVRVLGVLATFVVFIFIPLVDAAVSAASVLRRSSERRKEKYPLSGLDDFTEGARGILDNDNCIELISCSVAGFSARSDQLAAWTEWYLASAKPGSITSRILRGRQTPGSCGNFRCDPIGFIFRLFIYITDWNTILKA